MALSPHKIRYVSALAVTALCLLCRPAALPAAGRLAPDFEGSLLSGETFRLEDHIGRDLVVLNFFTTDCGPCREEFPVLDKFYAAHKSEGLVVLAVDVEESPALVKNFLGRMKISFPALIDGGELTTALAVNGYPTTVVIGGDGTIRYQQLGVIDPAAVLLPLLNEQQALAKEGGGISGAAFSQGQKQAGLPLLHLAPAEAKPTAGYVPDDTKANEIFSIKVAAETPRELQVDVDYYYKGDHGDKRIYIDCDPHVDGGGSPFGMLPATATAGRHTARAPMTSYAGTPSGAVSTTVTCSLSSRIDSAQLATKTISYEKTWEK